MAARPGKKKSRPSLFEGFRATSGGKREPDEVTGPKEQKILDSYHPSRESKLPPHMQVTSLPRVGVQAPKPPNSRGGPRPGGHVQQDPSIVTGRASVVDSDSVVLEMSKTAQVVGTLVLVVLLGAAFAAGGLVGSRTGLFGGTPGGPVVEDQPKTGAGTGSTAKGAGQDNRRWILIRRYPSNDFRHQAKTAQNQLQKLRLDAYLKPQPFEGGTTHWLILMGPYESADSSKLDRDMKRLKALPIRVTQAANLNPALFKVVDAEELKSP